jgi:hypothetical protein
MTKWKWCLAVIFFLSCIMPIGAQADKIGVLVDGVYYLDIGSLISGMVFNPASPGTIGGTTPGIGNFSQVSIGTTKHSTGHGSPEGVVAGAYNDAYNDLDAVGVYYKSTASGNTGWVKDTSVSVGNSKMVCTDSSGNPVACVGTETNPFGAVAQITGTSISLSSPAEFATCSSTCTATAPVPPATGSSNQFCVENNAGVSTVITIAMPASVMISNQAKTAYGTAGTGHGLTSGGAAKDEICFHSVDATHYNIDSAMGTWSAY